MTGFVIRLLKGMKNEPPNHEAGQSSMFFVNQVESRLNRCRSRRFRPPSSHHPPRGTTPTAARTAGAPLRRGGPPQTVQLPGSSPAGAPNGRLPLLTYPQPSLDLDFGALGIEEGECDNLPFDLDSDLSPGRGGGYSAASHAYELDASESDVAVGAFVRLIEKAPTLQGAPARSAALGKGHKAEASGAGSGGSGGGGPFEVEAVASGAGYPGSRITLAAGLSQLAKLRAQIE